MMKLINADELKEKLCKDCNYGVCGMEGCANLIVDRMPFIFISDDFPLTNPHKSNAGGSENEQKIF